MKADLAQREPEMLARGRPTTSTGRSAAVAARPPDLRAARRPALRHRAHAHRPRRQQGAQGHHRQSAHPDAGFDAPYVPGWDCHGLPIELKVDRELGPKKGRSSSAADFRARLPRVRGAASSTRCASISSASACSATGIIPTSRWIPRYEAEQIRALRQDHPHGHVYRGYKPVYWCLDCRSALAEAEVEYDDKTSPAIDVRFPVIADLALLRGSAFDAGAERRAGPALSRRSGPRRPGRCPPTRPSRCTPSSNTRWWVSTPAAASSA